MSVISPEVAELLERRRTELQALAKQSWSDYDDLVRRIRRWANATIESRVVAARLTHTAEQCAQLDANPVEYYKVPFPSFHEWLTRKEYELLRMSTIRQLFPISIEYGQLMDIMEGARNNASMHYLPRLVLVEVGADDAAIVCSGE